MDLQVLRWFTAVAQGATVTETAEREHITQPALSRALARLEREVGTPLLTRVGRGLRLTPAGREFHRHAAEILDRYNQGLRAVTELVDPDRGVVPLAFLHTLGTWLVPALVSGFRVEHPTVRFDLSEYGEAPMRAALLDGKVDLIFTSSDPHHPAVRWRRLLVEPLRLVIPQRHPLARRRQVRLAEVAEEPFVLLREGYGLRALTGQMCADAGFTPRIAFEGEDVETLRALVASGLGIALLPPPPTATAPAVPMPHLRVTDVDAARDIGLAWLDDRPLPPASSAFRAHVLHHTPALLPPAYARRR